jgi:hypothetical protein
MKKRSQYVDIVFAQNVHFGLVGKQRQDATSLPAKIHCAFAQNVPCSRWKTQDAACLSLRIYQLELVSISFKFCVIIIVIFHPLPPPPVYFCFCLHTYFTHIYHEKRYKNQLRGVSK